MPVGTRSRSSSRLRGLPLTSTCVPVGAAAPPGCASRAPVLVPEMLKSMRVLPGTTAPAWLADLTSASTATLPTSTVSRLLALAPCRAVVALSTTQALPLAAAGMVPCTSSSAVWPGSSASVPAAPGSSTRSEASTTPLWLASRATRNADRSSPSAGHPAPSLTSPRV
ncbi:hypothetical protein D3C87_1079800 [compost metagenome]